MAASATANVSCCAVAASWLGCCRKQLLNKCQEEFEKGAAAMEAVEAREKANEGKSKEEQETDQAEVSYQSSQVLQLPCLHCAKVS